MVGNHRPFYIFSQMTNREYISKTLSGFGISDDDVDIILLKADLDGGMIVDVEKADNAIYNRFSIVLKEATQNVSEGGYSVSWNVPALRLYYSQLCHELKKPNVLEPKPKIRNKSHYW